MATAATEKASQHSSQTRFHQHFILTASPEKGRPDPIRVTYADCDYRERRNQPDITASIDRPDTNQGPVLLFIGGMFGTRYMSMGNMDALARKHRLRVIVPDKFGLGGTPNILLEWRVSGFIDLIRELLNYLEIKHVSLASHSAGTTYILNAVLQLRDFLHPRNPFICLLAPWVHPTYSGKLQSLNVLPDAAIRQWDKIAWLFGGAIGSLQMSAPKLISYGNAFSGALSRNEPASTEGLAPPDYDDRLDYGPSESIGPELENQVRSCMFAENTKGAVEEVFLCLRRGPGVSWGCFEGFEAAISQICRVEAARHTNRAAVGPAQETGPTPTATEADQQGKLRVQIYFAESDGLTGPKGRDWTDSMWHRFSEMHESVIYDSKIAPGSGHDSIFGVKFGIVDELFATARRLWVP